MPTADIKRGVSLYSFQEEVFLRKMDLEDCIKACAAMGANGIEVVSEQSFNEWPNLSDATYDRWHQLMAENGTVPVCHDLMLDTKMRKGQVLSLDEQVQSIIRDLKHAKRLGCPFTRVLVFVSPDVLEKAIPYAEEYDVKMLLEVHAPLHFDHPWINRHMDMMERSGSQHVGFLPDMGMFLKHYPKVWSDKFRRLGARAEIVDYIVKAYDDRTLSEYVFQDVRDMGAKGPELGMVETIRHNLFAEPKRMLDFMHRIHNIHGKFYEITEDYVEPSIPYDEIVSVLKQGGYRGYICSEYEGNRWIQDAYDVDSVEQVRRQHVMLDRLINAPAIATQSEKKVAHV
jgi:sugar phosphate isomerase/epimerase